MQEEVENRTLALIVSSAKLTERVLVNAVRKYLEYKRVGKQGKNGMSKVSPHGKQTIKELVEQNQGIEKTDIDKNDIGKFKRVARKYGLDYAVRKSPDEDKFIVFFKAHDGIAMNAALNEYINKSTSDRVSVIAKMKEMIPKRVPVIRKKERER